MYPDDEILEISKVVSEIFGEKIWLNLGALKEEELTKISSLLGGNCLQAIEQLIL
jgi:hypothetical protein